jgi:peptidoglycan/LPS O-acetylase OafA/YrhL
MVEQASLPASAASRGRELGQVASPPPLMRRLTALDGLRTLAVMLVFAHHLDQHALPGGFIGVDVFFVISGYLITALLLREYHETGKIALGQFYLRRALRLYPALLVMVVLIMPIASMDHIGEPVLDGLAALSYVTDFWSNYVGHLTLFLHTWSLSVEEQFYLVWPLILIVALDRRWPVRRLVVLGIVITVVITYGIYRAHIGRLSEIQWLPTSHIAELGAGILLAFAEFRGVGHRLVSATGTLVALIALGLLVVAELALPARWWAFPLDALVCWVPVAHLVIHRGSWISAAFRWQPVVWLGRRSYGFYLWHYPIILLLARQRDLTPLEIGAIAFPCTLAITALSWRLVETPCLKLKDRFVPRVARATA